MSDRAFADARRRLSEGIRGANDSRRSADAHRRGDNFQRVSDFWGEYTGSHDGREARLEIGDVPADAPHPIFRITFEDLDRGRTYRGVHSQRTRPPDGDHVLTDVQLDEVGGTGTKTYRKLLLHTWDTDFLTGISLWQGREFGASYRRVS